MKRYPILFITAMFAVMSTAFAATITLEASDSYVVTSNTTSTTDSFSFVSAADSVFVVAVASDANVGANASATFDPSGSNISMSQLASAQSVDNGALWVHLFAAEIGDPGTASLDFEVSTGAISTRPTYTAFQLGNATVSGAVSDSSGAQDATLTVGSLDPGGAMIDILIDGSHGDGGSAFGSPDGTIRLPGASSGGPGFNRGVISGWYLDRSGDVTGGYNEGAAQASLGVGFQAIPEPGTLALTGLALVAGIAFARKRR